MLKRKRRERRGIEHGRKEGREKGRKKGRGRKGRGRKDRREEGKTDGRKEERTEEQRVGGKEGGMEGSWEEGQRETGAGEGRTDSVLRATDFQSVYRAHALGGRTRLAVRDVTQYTQVPSQVMSFGGRLPGAEDN